LSADRKISRACQGSGRTAGGQIFEVAKESLQRPATTGGAAAAGDARVRLAVKVSRIARPFGKAPLPGRILLKKLNWPTAASFNDN